MAPQGRGIPRFLPTLTEVVRPGVPPLPGPEPQEAVAAHGVSPALTEPVPQPVSAPAPVPVDAILRLQVEERVRQIVAGALSAQVERITGQVMGELEPALRQLLRENRASGPE